MTQINTIKKIFHIALLPVILLLAACGPSNTLMGKWQSEPIMGNSNSMEFKSGSIIVNNEAGSVETKIKGYTVEKDRVGVIIPQGDNTVTGWFKIVDADTISQDIPGLMTLRFHRQK